ncbi:unnamed protein product, partial [Cyprideis torosa]
YFGKTRGLLGTFNNEPFDDFSRPDGKRQASLEKFVNAWKTEDSHGSCEPEKNYAIRMDPSNSIAYEQCQNIFMSRQSTLGPCFQRVNPEPYVQMCYADMERMSNRAEQLQQGPCYAAAAYMSACRAEGVDIWMPSSCVRCALENGHVLSGGESITYTAQNGTREVDFILALDGQKCVDPGVLSKAFVRALEGGFLWANLHSARYALLGWNGVAPFSEPYAHSAEGSQWLASESLQRQLYKLKKAPKSTTSGNVYDVLKYALKLPFRAGVSKVMVVVTCSRCDVTDTVEYSDLLNSLLEKGISLHFLQPEEIETLGRKKFRVYDKPIGYDAEKAYAIRDAVELEGDFNIRQIIRTEKNLCHPLALETKGSIFSVNETKQSTRQLKKRAWSAIGKRIAITGKPSECQRCDCVPSDTGLGTTICHPCLPPSLKSEMDEWLDGETGDEYTEYLDDEVP